MCPLNGSDFVLPSESVYAIDHTHQESVTLLFTREYLCRFSIWSSCRVVHLSIYMLTSFHHWVLCKRLQRYSKAILWLLQIGEYPSRYLEPLTANFKYLVVHNCEAQVHSYPRHCSAIPPKTLFSNPC